MVFHRAIAHQSKLSPKLYILYLDYNAYSLGDSFLFYLKENFIISFKPKPSATHYLNNIFLIKVLYRPLKLYLN